MKANRGHQIVAKAVWAKTKHGDEFCESGRASGVIGVARILAMDMRAKRAGHAHRISSERELILANLIGVRSDTGNRLLLHRYQWIASAGAAHECRSKLFSLHGISTALLVDELPEASHVLP